MNHSESILTLESRLIGHGPTVEGPALVGTSLGMPAALAINLLRKAIRVTDELLDLLPCEIRQAIQGLNPHSLIMF